MKYLVIGLRSSKIQFIYKINNNNHNNNNNNYNKYMYTSPIETKLDFKDS